MALRVCADPNNLPFSNEARDGLENHLAELLARDLGMKLEYTWWSEGKNFIDNSLNSGRCDAVMGIPADLPSVAVTRHYYRSTYVFVTQRERDLSVSSLYDPRLARLRIGVQVAGDDYVPPAQALARRGLSANLIGFSLYGATGEANPAARIIDAVRNGDIDIAIAWGPMAGYFARKYGLALAPVTPSAYQSIPFVYDIAVGVRKNDVALRDAIDRSLMRQCPAIRSLVRNFEIPEVLEGGPLCESSRPQSALSR